MGPIKLDNPNSIQKGLCEFSRNGETEKLRELLKIKAVRQEIDKGEQIT